MEELGGRRDVSIASRLVFALVLPSLYLTAVVIASWQLRPMPAMEADPIEIAGGVAASQSFRTGQSDFSGIDLYLDPLGRRNSGVITLHLRLARPDATELYAAPLDVSRVTHPGFYSFALKPRKFPADTQLVFTVDAPDASPGNALAVALTRDDLDRTGSAVVGEKASGDLLFHARYASSMVSAVRSPVASVPDLFRAVASGKPGLAGRIWPYALLMVSTALLLGALGWVLGGASLRKRASQADVRV